MLAVTHFPPKKGGLVIKRLAYDTDPNITYRGGNVLNIAVHKAIYKGTPSNQKNKTIKHPLTR